MWIHFTLLSATSLLAIGVVQTAADNRDQIRQVHGYLDMHWEYPNFLPDDLPGVPALPFQFTDDRWAIYTKKPVWDAYRYRPSEIVCFRVAGRGYVTARKLTTMWPADRKFVFTEVTEMTLMTSSAECDKRMERHDD